MRITALALLLLTGCAPSVLLPPQALRHEPTRPFVDLRFSSADMPNACRALHGVNPDSCATIGPVPLRITPNDASREKSCLLIWHENGHLNEARPNPAHVGWEWSTPEDLKKCPGETAAK